MTLGERLEWLGRMTLLVFILGSAAFLSAITAMRIAIHGREVTMPNLVGINVSEASKMLQSRGLLLRVADRVYSDQPINAVVRQTPPSGLLMKVSGAEPRATAIADTAAGRKFPKSFANRAAAGGIAGWRGFGDYDDGPAYRCGGDSESEAGSRVSDTARRRTGFARATGGGLCDAALDWAKRDGSAAPA